jgi:hypothetical protein
VNEEKGWECLWLFDVDMGVEYIEKLPSASFINPSLLRSKLNDDSDPIFY